MTTRSSRDRTAILADINEIQAQGTVAGTLTAKTRELADGRTAVYHQMRWSLAGADALLPFRTAHLSGRYDELWEFILDRRKKMANAA